PLVVNVDRARDLVRRVELARHRPAVVAEVSAALFEVDRADDELVRRASDRLPLPAAGDREQQHSRQANLVHASSSGGREDAHRRTYGGAINVARAIRATYTFRSLTLACGHTGHSGDQARIASRHKTSIESRPTRSSPSPAIDAPYSTTRALSFTSSV